MIRFDMTCKCFSGVGSLQKKACKACTREGRDVDMTMRFKWSHSRFEEIQRNQSAGQKPVTIFDNGGLCESKGLGSHVTTSIPFRMPLRKNLAVGESKGSKGTCCTETNWATLRYNLGAFCNPGG
jgi:hypothetical protein